MAPRHRLLPPGLLYRWHTRGADTVGLPSGVLFRPWRVRVAGEPGGWRLLWWFDALRVPLRFALPGFVACLAGLTGVSLAFPQEEWVAFFPDAYVSKFVRSGVQAISELSRNGYLESSAHLTERLRTLPEATNP